ncbi:hypothetical protein ACISNY_08100, partial [Campylobacter jejuni]
EIPVVGLDFLVEAADQHDYVIIEANERAGLANPEPQQTADRFVDILFPLNRGMPSYPLCHLYLITISAPTN